MGRQLSGDCGWWWQHVHQLFWLLMLLRLPVSANVCPHTNNCKCQTDACFQQNNQTISTCRVQPVALCRGLFYRRLPEGFHSHLLTVASTGHHFYGSQGVHFNISINSLLPSVEDYNILVEGQWNGQSMSSFNETYVVSIFNQNSSLVDVSMRCSCGALVLTSVRITVLLQKDHPCDIVQAESIVLGNDTSKVKVKRDNGAFSIHYDMAAYILRASMWERTNCSSVTMGYCPTGHANTNQPDKIYYGQEKQCVPYFVYLEFLEKPFQEIPHMLEYWFFYMMPEKTSLPSTKTSAVNSSTSLAYQGPVSPSTTLQTSLSGWLSQSLSPDRHSTMFTSDTSLPKDQEMTTDQQVSAEIKNDLSNYSSTSSTTLHVPVETKTTVLSSIVHLSAEHSITIAFFTAKENSTFSHNLISSEKDILVSVLSVLLVIVVGLCGLLFFWLRKKKHTWLLTHSPVEDITLTTKAGSDTRSVGTAVIKSPLLLLYYNQDCRHVQLVNMLCSHLQSVGTINCCVVGDTASLNDLHKLLLQYGGRLHAVLVLCSALRHILSGDDASTASWRNCLLDKLGEWVASFNTISFDGELSERDQKYFRSVFGKERTCHMSGEHSELGTLFSNPKLNWTTDSTSLVSECLTVHSVNV